MCMRPLLKLLEVCRTTNNICWSNSPSTSAVGVNFTLHVMHEWARQDFGIYLEIVAAIQMGEAQ